MKKVHILLTLILFILSCTGCISYYATPLTANSIKGITDTAGPSITDPDEGWHPYASLVYFDKQLLSDLFSSAETMRGGALSAGFNFHRNLEEKNSVHTFFGSSLSTSLLHYTPYFTQEQYTDLSQQGVSFVNPLIDYSIELTVKPGFLVYWKNLLNSYYVLAIAEYENGDYASLRKRADGIQNTYNLAANSFSFGFGFGTDFQIGKVREFDVGFNAEYCSIINRTQSVPYAFIENNITDRPSLGGEIHRYSSYKIGPYIDYGKLRISCMMTDNELASFNVLYRF